MEIAIASAAGVAWSTHEKPDSTGDVTQTGTQNSASSNHNYENTAEGCMLVDLEYSDLLATPPPDATQRSIPMSPHPLSRAAKAQNSILQAREPEIEHLITAVLKHVRQGSDPQSGITFTDTMAFWTAVLFALPITHTLRISLNPLRDARSLYSKHRKQAIAEYGTLADERKRFKKVPFPKRIFPQGYVKKRGKRNAAVVCKTVECDGKIDPQAAKAPKKPKNTQDPVKKARKARKKEKRMLFGLQGIREALEGIAEKSDGIVANEDAEGKMEVD